MNISPPTTYGSLRELVRDASAQPLPDEDTIRRLAAMAAAGDSDAREQLIERHLRLVVDETIAHRGERVHSLALVREGLRALARSAQAYDPTLGETFTRYARRSIRSSMRRVFFAN